MSTDRMDMSGTSTSMRNISLDNDSVSTMNMSNNLNSNSLSCQLTRYKMLP